MGRFLVIAWAIAATLMLTAMPARAVNLSIDYTYDTTNFFGSGNPQGATAGLKAKTSLEAAADYFSAILTDTFSKIQTPPVYHSQASDGTVTWNWTADFVNPTSGAAVSLSNKTIAADEYRIYAGARSLPGSTLGNGGPGGYSWSSNPTGSFTQSEINQINQITDNFAAAVETRGEGSGFARWGGSLSFDRDASTVWNFDHTTGPVPGKSDFYSVAIHELAHCLGFGAITGGSPPAEWESLVSGSNFTGSASASEYGSPVPLTTDKAHWVNNTTSTVFGSWITQEAAMDPSLTQGKRKLFTELDAAGLDDIGWTVVEPPILTGDYNGDGRVDVLDYVVWRNNLGTRYAEADFLAWKANFGNTALGSGAIVAATVPEPASIALMGLSLLGIAVLRRR